MGTIRQTTALEKPRGWRTLLRVSVIVLVVGFLAGIVAGMPLVGTEDERGIVDTLGRAFVEFRVVTLFVLALPAIGVCEHFGLHEQARVVVRRISAATVGRLQLVYHLFRIGVVALGIRLGSGHVTFSRPLIVPMALGAGGLDAERDLLEVERVKGLSGASENYANFFGQNLFPAAAGVAIILKTLAEFGYEVDAVLVAYYTIPMATASLLVAACEYMLFDWWLRLRGRQRGGEVA